MKQSTKDICKSVFILIFIFSFYIVICPAAAKVAQKNESAPKRILAMKQGEKLAVPAQAKIKLLHEFAGDAFDGAFPHGSLIISGTTLYGMTCNGGRNNMGMIFKIQRDGTGYAQMHAFAGGVNDGANPFGSLLLAGSALYGMTSHGGYGYGTVFKIETDGSGFSLLHALGYSEPGCWPEGSLIISGTTLYGIGKFAGNYRIHEALHYGGIFKLQTDGSDFRWLHAFMDGLENGTSQAAPTGSLVLSGSILYGTTSAAIFKIKTDGSDYFELRNLYFPRGSLIISGTTLYGTTSVGTSYGNDGTIFRIETDGSDYSRLHRFAPGVGDGEDPHGTPIRSGSTLYCMTTYGGKSDMGTIFKIQTDGSGYSVLHHFAGGPADGSQPFGDLVLSGSNLIGMTFRGGIHDKGVIFSLPLTNISVTAPNGNENWMIGDSQDIIWTADSSISRVNIDYSADNGGHWIPMATGTANDGRYTWAVPNTPSPACLVRISDANDALVSDSSDNPFSILIGIDLAAERREIKAFTILRQYGKIQFLVQTASDQVAQYRVLRRQGTR